MSPIDGVPGVENATLIGQGGFGDVFRADQTQLDRVVAVKILHLRPDDETVRVFRRESRALGRLSSHPNIVTLYQADLTEDGYPFMVMEYASTGSLEDQLRRSGPLRVEQVVEVGGAMCSALNAAHAIGIRHRDLKPANIFWSDHDVPLLGDFGIATLAGRTQTESRKMTATIAHASPEQLKGSELDHRTDIYSLGSTLYHLASGRPAHAPDWDTDIMTIITGVLTREPVPIIGVPPHVNTAILAAMAKSPDDRPTLVTLQHLLAADAPATRRLPVPDPSDDGRPGPGPGPGPEREPERSSALRLLQVVTTGLTLVCLAVVLAASSGKFGNPSDWLVPFFTVMTVAFAVPAVVVGVARRHSRSTENGRW